MEKKLIVKELQELADLFVKKAEELNLLDEFKEYANEKVSSEGVILNTEIGLSFQGDSEADIKLVLASMRIGSVIHKTKHFGYNENEPEWEEL